MLGIQKYVDFVYIVQFLGELHFDDLHKNEGTIFRNVLSKILYVHVKKALLRKKKGMNVWNWL